MATIIFPAGTISGIESRILDAENIMNTRLTLEIPKISYDTGDNKFTIPEIKFWIDFDQYDNEDPEKIVSEKVLYIAENVALIAD